MSKPIVKHIPNLLSVMRIFLSIALLFLTTENLRWLFVVIYLLNGATDVFDGKIARRFDAVSSLGSKLDAVGDTMLFVCAAVGMLFLAKLDVVKAELLKSVFVLSFGVIYKVANVFVTRVRFKQWNMMHTLMNKAVFVTLYFYVPIFLLLNEINFPMVAAISVLICLACLEETVTLMKLDEYDVDCKGIFGEKLAAKLPGRKAA